MCGAAQRHLLLVLLVLGVNTNCCSGLLSTGQWEVCIMYLL